MLDPAERLINLALYLSASRRPVTAEECRSEGLGYPEGQDDATFLRMFERDKDALRAAGLVIEVLSDGETEAYRLDAAATFARPITLSSAEVSAVRAVAAALSADTEFPFRHDLALALGKLGTVDNDRPMATTELTGESAPELALHTRALAEAVQMRKGVSFDYTNATGVERRRTVCPYGVFFRDGLWYLTGLDRDAEAIRTFAIARIRNLDVNPARPRSHDFERPADFDVREQERLPFQYGSDLFPARIRFQPDVAWRAEGLARGRGVIETLPDGSAVWSVNAANLDHLATWILDQGPGLLAVEPPRLVEAISDGLRRVVASHG